MSQQPKIIWDKGSAYDFFVSLWIIHRPDDFGLRPSWAAGVRSRMPLPLREVLEQSQMFINVPMHWVYRLPGPKNAKTALDALKALPPQDLLPALVNEKDENHLDFLRSLEGKCNLTAKIEEQLRQYRQPKRTTKPSIRAIFNAWSDRTGFGERLLEALEIYYMNFFAEEETRIIPTLMTALEEVRSLAAEKGLLTTLEEYSAGVRMDWITDLRSLVMAPSFWGAPFVFFDSLDEETGIILFGARPRGTALVPGELVPEDLLNSLKALADPTRLRVLRYLQEAPCTPSELAKYLRLRPPTVVHHLRVLRLAGLVLVNVTSKAERRYAIRTAGIEATVRDFNSFISGDLHS
jgi:DNA-binding transcriptional ArsR family regulator